MKQLLINADDFGLTEAVSAGIVRSMVHGVVSCTTAMVAVPGAVERIARLGGAITGRVGLHLQLTDGVPCAGSAVPTLFEQGTHHFPHERGAVGTMLAEEIAIEWRAQVERFRSTGLPLARIDSHHHVHHQPAATEAFIDLASELGVPARGGPAALRDRLRERGVRCADRLETSWFGGELTVERFLRMVERAFERTGGDGLVEVMCHPGLVDPELARWSAYTEERERELEVLTSPELAEGLAAMGVAITQ